MADLDPEVVAALVRLLENLDDMSAMSEEELERSLVALGERQMIQGRVAAELNRRGWTWLKIGQRIGVNQSTVHRWAFPPPKKQSAAGRGADTSGDDQT